MKTHIYLEGGGGKDQDSRCREGFRKFLEKCGFGNRMPKLTACGARNSAYDDFKTAHVHASSNDYVALLVDSEGPVQDINRPWTHLNERDSWRMPEGASEDQVLLMATCMETWIVADPDTLKSHFGQCLQPSALPSLNNLEGKERKVVLTNLIQATRNCPGPYSKGQKSYELLGKLNPDAIEPYLPSFKRARTILDGKL